ncbi:hypothetical protein EVAR_55285_1 [Eumeta japonica]|uniref:Uncharacterized protein n=1 Tax=Eumeta variegata TaxID=151549 RepID=A0A4C1ZEZ7_EUMVA|nr:hypothetical protein EVAR_55285_1 [Eumeta japonica]
MNLALLDLLRIKLVYGYLLDDRKFNNSVWPKLSSSNTDSNEPNLKILEPPITEIDCKEVWYPREEGRDTGSKEYAFRWRLTASERLAEQRNEEVTRLSRIRSAVRGNSMRVEVELSAI